VVSGTVPEHDLIRAMRSGARDYIQKGNLNRLVPAIRRELAENAARRTGRETHRRREEYFGFVIDNTSDVILLLDARLSIVFESPAMQRMLGYAREDMLGRPFTDL